MYVSAPEAMLQIFNFNSHEQMLIVVRLDLHLDTALEQKTTLTGFFKAGEIGEEARKYPYQVFPEYFVYNKSQHKWTPRRQRHSALGYMPLTDRGFMS
jgi:hypothetical protein